MPGQPDFMETDFRLHAVLRTLRFVYRHSLLGLRIADLGCAEGGFSLALAQKGANLLGIEARAKNLEKCSLLKAHFGLPNLKFIQDDVKNFTRKAFETFDVVLALGILYHLDKPVEWLQQVAEATKTILIVDSHYAPADDSSLKLVDPQFKLGSLERTDIDGRTCEGRWCVEYEEDSDWLDQREDKLWASYSNPKSFWLTKQSLFLALLHAGFDLVFEQHDCWGRQPTTWSRGMFVAAKSGSFKPVTRRL